jgi:hypothetical protein
MGANVIFPFLGFLPLVAPVTVDLAACRPPDAARLIFSGERCAPIGASCSVGLGGFGGGRNLISQRYSQDRAGGAAALLPSGRNGRSPPPSISAAGVAGLAQPDRETCWRCPIFALIGRYFLSAPALPPAPHVAAELKDEIARAKATRRSRAGSPDSAERSKKRMMAAVPKHRGYHQPDALCGRIAYESGKMGRRGVAKGVDHLALSIRKVAEEHDVPRVENPPLARALCRRRTGREKFPPNTTRRWRGSSAASAARPEETLAH